jgi:peptide/nickel transport system permease protein
VRFLATRLLAIPVSLLVIVTLTFGLVELMPGDPAVTIAGNFANPQEVARIRADLGLDRPLLERYGAYVGRVARGDLGTSYFSDRPVRSELGERLPATAELVVLALLVAGALGLAIGMLGAYFARRLPDRLARTVTTAFQSTPDFLLALLLIYLLFFVARIAPPPVGRSGLLDEGAPDVTGFLLIDAALTGSLAQVWQAIQQLMLPVLALGLVYSAYFAKVSRATMASALASAQVEFARACGLPERRVLGYAFTQARAPIVTYVAILFGSLLGGAAIVERIFSWQGVGQWGLDAVLKLDVPVIQGFVLAAGLVTIVVYLVLDLVVLLLDPRVSYG